MIDMKNNPFSDMMNAMAKASPMSGGMMPGADSMMEFNRKNMAAFQQALQVSADGARKAMALQREQLEQALSGMRSQMGAKGELSASTMFTAPATIATHLMEMNMKNASDMAGIATETGMKSFEVMRARAEESVKDFTEAFSGK